MHNSVPCGRHRLCDRKRCDQFELVHGKSHCQRLDRCYEDPCLFLRCDGAGKIDRGGSVNIETAPSPCRVKFRTCHSQPVCALLLVGQGSATVAILVKRNFNLQSQTVVQVFLRHRSVPNSTNCSAQVRAERLGVLLFVQPSDWPPDSRSGSGRHSQRSEPSQSARCRRSNS